MLTYKALGSGSVQSGAFPEPDTGDLDVTVLNATGRKTVPRPPESGFTTTLLGRGLSDDSLVAPTGTIRKIEIRNASGDLVGEISGMTWKAARLITALERAYDDNDWRA